MWIRLVHLPIECLMSGRPCLCHQQAFLDSMSWNLRQQDFLALGPGGSLRLSPRCHIANSIGALNMFVRIYLRSLRNWSDSQVAAQVQREADNDEERQCLHQSLDRSWHIKATLRGSCRWPFFQIEVPHKAVAEISRIGPYRRGELLRCMDGRANSLMDRKVVGVVLFGVVAMVAIVPSLTTPGCSVV